MSQLRIDYETCNENSTKNVNNATPKGKSTKTTSRNFAVLQGNWSECSLARKARELQRVRPKFAAVIEGLMDDALREAAGRKY